ncbi:uncharacterized protein LOC124446559 isoform X2 [Xenia sp. Carnegie-2017]|uniref:uncharacterized protein LOC124446559 isoform X2 n=1 Tax=Xenia sp. Carnegie-2017 TaxID=2897299 RepID=UPI001F04C9FC|nr:uncharacterized protein LOC124446559 isoform X2 [Xenia sp. Carnegie-2017]
MKNFIVIACIFFSISGLNTIAVYPDTYVASYPKSCMEIKQSSPESLSGLYRIVVDDTVVTVYCEMAKEGGGFTFIPREAVIKGKLPQLINQVFKNKTQVLLRIQKKDGLQPFTLITQLPRFTQHNLAVLMHNYNGYTQPQNYYMRDYLFLVCYQKMWHGRELLKVSDQTEKGYLCQL